MIQRILFFLGLALQFSYLSAQPEKELETDQKKVLVVPFKGTVELGLAPFIQRSVEYAEENNFDALILDVDTFGGRVDAAVEIRDALVGTSVQTVAWINRRAISAGALVSLACEKIFFTNGSSMGAATPIQAGGGEAKDAGEKFVSYMQGEMRATAERHDRNGDIAEAMVKAKKDIDDLIEKGKVLTLTDKTALKYKMSNGTKETLEDVLKAIDLDEAYVENFSINWAEKIVRFLTDPTVSGLLMSAGVLGILFELQSPGFGIPGIVGASCLALFFFGKFIVQLAGWEEVILVLAGITLIAVEIFVAPGTILFGLGGVLLLIYALFLAGVSPKVPVDLDLPSVEQHLQSMTIGLLVTLVGVVFMYWFLSKYPRAVPVVLNLSGSPNDEKQLNEASSKLVGKEGELLTDLRPSGKAVINGVHYHVLSETGFLKQGAQVKVVEVDGTKVVVKEV